MVFRLRSVLVLLGTALTIAAATALPASAAFPGQPSKILFWSQRNGSTQLFTMHPDGTKQTLVGAGISGHPGQLSPDGTRITYVSSPGAGYEVYVADVDGSNPLQLTTTGETIFDPSWNPAGTRIVYSVWVTANSSLEVFTVSASGGTPHQVTDTPAIDEYEPVWSPDGRYILVTANNDNDAVYNFDLYRYRTDGTHRKRLTNTPGAYESSPDYRADGKRISYTRYVSATSKADVITMAADGTHIHNVTKSFAPPVSYAIWLPNGRIAFGARPGGEDSEIWAINPNGTNRDRLTSNNADDDVSFVT
jgi:TolB protein